MSWNVEFIGKPQAVAKALSEHSENLQGQLKEEYDAALPHLVGLVEQNFSPIDPGRIIKIKAYGHGTINDKGEIADRNCVVTIEPTYGLVV
jgi:hypothetical protein